MSFLYVPKSLQLKQSLRLHQPSPTHRVGTWCQTPPAAPKRSPMAWKTRSMELLPRDRTRLWKKIRPRGTKTQRWGGQEWLWRDLVLDLRLWQFAHCAIFFFFPAGGYKWGLDIQRAISTTLWLLRTRRRSECCRCYLLYLHPPAVRWNIIILFIVCLTSPADLSRWIKGQAHSNHWYLKNTGNVTFQTICLDFPWMLGGL